MATRQLRSKDGGGSAKGHTARGALHRPPKDASVEGPVGLLHREAVSLACGQQICFFSANFLQKMTWLQT